MVQFASYLRCVLCKTRLIFPRINGPNVVNIPNNVVTMLQHCVAVKIVVANRIVLHHLLRLLAPRKGIQIQDSGKLLNLESGIFKFLNFKTLCNPESKAWSPESH